jgi:hypothetical protein
MAGQLTRSGVAVRSQKGGVGPVAGIADPVARDVARWATARGLAPIAMSGFSLGFGIIAATWLTGISLRAEMTAFAALLASYVSGRAARLMGDWQAGPAPREGVQAPATDWARAACAILTEIAVYAGIAGGASVNAVATAGTGLTGPVGEQLRDTSLAGFGGAGADGVWRLAVTAVIVLASQQMTAACLAATPGRVARFPRLRRLHVLIGLPGRERLIVIGVVVMLAGARATFAVLLGLGVLAIVLLLTARRRGAEQDAADPPVTDQDAADQAVSDWLLWIGRYRGDGPLSLWIGRLVGGRLSPMPPLIVGLMVTCVLASLGMGNLSGILAFTPVEAMLLATLGSWHPHDLPWDWLVPALLQAGEYIFLAALGFGGLVPPPVTFALLAAVALRHLDLAYRARNRLTPARFELPAEPGKPPPRLPGADTRGLGWEGRMLLAAIASAMGVLPSAYALGALYLWILLAWDFAAGWSAGHSAVYGQRGPGHE